MNNYFTKNSQSSDVLGTTDFLSEAHLSRAAIKCMLCFDGGAFKSIGLK